MRSLAAILTFLLVWGAFVPAQAADKEKESSYDRIMRTGTIRCGYLPYEPYISKDVVSGALSGVTVDYINAVAKRLGLSVDWSEEVNVDQIAPALNYGRIDMVCIPCTPDHNQFLHQSEVFRQIRSEFFMHESIHFVIAMAGG